MPTVLSGGNKIILANWPDDKHIIYTINNDIPIKILSHSYVLVNRSVLCNCGIEAENTFLLESLATCHDAVNNLVMYFTLNTTFLNNIDQFNLTEGLTFPILSNKTMLEYTLPIFLNDTSFDRTLMSAPQTLKNIFYSINWRKKFLIWKKGMISMR